MKKGLADPRGWLRFQLWLREHRPEIVHAHLPHATLFCRFSRFFGPIPVLVDTVHTPATGPMGRRLGYWLTRAIPDQLTAVSHGTAQAWLQKGLLQSDRLSILPNGVDLEHFRPDIPNRVRLRLELGLSDGFLWVAVGRLAAVKDYPTLLHAFGRLPENSMLAIVGAGPEEAALRQLAGAIGLGPRIRFLGFLEDTAPLLAAADGFVLSSRWEGLPVSLLEAGAAGLPAVATPVTGAAEILIEGETGRLASAIGDPSALAATMQAVMEITPQERSAMGRSARLRVSARFGLEQVLDRWESLYRMLLAREASR